MGKTKSKKKRKVYVEETIDVCPNCGEADDLTGIEFQGKYDGISEWICKNCGCHWDRRTEEIIREGEEGW